jgi:hypothetical protein
MVRSMNVRKRPTPKPPKKKPSKIKLSKQDILETIQFACERSVTELGFLAVNSKIESAIRDRVAWRMHCKLDRNLRTVTREWKRRDLAILRGSTPKQVVEFKAGWLYDYECKSATPNHGNFVVDLVSDKKKRLRDVTSGAELYLVLLMSDCVDTPVKHLAAFPYLVGIKRLNNDNLCGREHFVARITERIKETKALQAPLSCFTKSWGKPFGIRTNIHVWVIGPFRRKKRKMAPAVNS